AAVRGWNRVRVDGGAGGERTAGAKRRRRAAAAHGGDERSSVRGLPLQEQRGIRPRHSARSRLLGVGPALESDLAELDQTLGSFCLSMIFSENRFTLFGIML